MRTGARAASRAAASASWTRHSARCRDVRMTSDSPITPPSASSARIQLCFAEQFPSTRSTMIAHGASRVRRESRSPLEPGGSESADTGTHGIHAPCSRWRHPRASCLAVELVGDDSVSTSGALVRMSSSTCAPLRVPARQAQLEQAAVANKGKACVAWQFIPENPRSMKNVRSALARARARRESVGTFPDRERFIAGNDTPVDAALSALGS